MLDKAETDDHNQKRAHLPSHSLDKWDLVEGLRDKSEAGTRENTWGSERKCSPHKLLTGR